MFILTYPDEDDNWVELDNILEEAVIQMLNKPDLKWLIISSSETSFRERRDPECMLYIATGTKERYHITFHERRMDTSKSIAIDITKWKSREQVFVQGDGRNATHRLRETVTLDYVKEAIAIFFREKKIADTHDVVWKRIR
jgi:hypothetical protein